jgi:microcystin-dependent protein
MDPYVGEIRMFGGTFAPRGWADCNGQLLSIDPNSALFSLIGTTYGGDGQNNFALPDLRSRIPIGVQGNNLGERAGTESVTLTSATNGAHAHPAGCGGDATTTNPVNGYWAKDPGNNVAQFTAKAPTAVMAGDAITPSGSSQPHENIQPFLCIRYIIALEGLYPPHS